MARGYIITVGASLVDGRPYGSAGTVYALPGAEDEALSVKTQAAAQGFTVSASLAGVGATAAAFRSAVTAVAATATSDDLVVLYFSGHGTILRAPTLTEDPSASTVSFFNAALAFYERPFLDDELIGLYALFKPGTRILVLLDACYAGGMSDGLDSLPLEAQLSPGTPAFWSGPLPSARLPSLIERAYLDWFGRGRDSVEVSLAYAKRFDRLIPFHVAELAFVANLPAYRAALPDRRWPATVAEFNSKDYIAPQTRHRIQLAPKAIRDGILTRAFSEGLVADDDPRGLSRWTLVGPHRDLVVDVLGGRLARRIRGFDHALSRRTAARARPAVGPHVQMLSATGDGYCRMGLFTPQLLLLQPDYPLDHVQFAKDLDAAVRAQPLWSGQRVARAYSVPEPTAFTLQRPWQV
jgi:hypothetical protein